MAWKVPSLFQKALDWFLRRLGLGPTEKAEQAARAAQRARLEARHAQLRAVQQIWDAAAVAEAAGIAIGDFRAGTVEQLRADWGPKGARLREVYAQAVQSSFSRGRYRQLSTAAARQLWPMWTYTAVLDSRTTSTCRALSGTLLPCDHPFWHDHTPPLHFRCRSALRGVTQAEADERGGMTQEVPQAEAQEGFGWVEEHWAPRPEGVPAPLWEAFLQKAGIEVY